MNKIDEQILLNRQNANSVYEDIVDIELEKINRLYDGFEDHTNEIFVSEIIEAFCKIIELQREKIRDLEMEVNAPNINVSASNISGFGSKPSGQGFIPFTKTIIADNNDFLPTDFKNDMQLQAAFTDYCISNGKSTYTINDYCSRIRNVWKSFYDEYKNGKLAKEIQVNEEKVRFDSPLLNVFNHTDEINCYISEKIADDKTNRNWANARAAFNKLEKFRLSVER